MDAPTENSSYEIILPQFKGPFDLLLFFIERDELDIYDIPIHTITGEFLAYIQQMKELNIEVASEFILVAATLMKIKAQMLIPRKQLDEDGNEIDPRKELVQKILEYKQYKILSEHLAKLEEDQYLRVKRSSAGDELKSIADIYKTDLEMEHLNGTKLFKVFEKLLQNKKFREENPTHEINYVKYSIENEKSSVLNQLTDIEKIPFENLFDKIEFRLHAIYHFLAILELVQEEKITMIVGEGINNFWISKRLEDESKEAL